MLELQNKLPNARVVYASATGASEPRNMAYMVRLGMWGEGTPFPDFNDFITAVEKRSVIYYNSRVNCCVRIFFMFGNIYNYLLLIFQGSRCYGDRGHGYETPRHVHSKTA